MHWNSLSRRECLVSAAALAASAVIDVPAFGASATPSRASLFPGERVTSGAGFPALAMFRRGERSKPLVLLLPGGGHLGRVFYGHPGARDEDFLLTHLSRAGFSTLALSYPTSHPVLDRAVPEMTIAQWSATAADIAAEYIGREQLPRRVIAAAWSLGGRLARDILIELRTRAIDLEVFISLSGAPPMPGFGVLSQADLKLSPAGLRDDSSAQSSIFKSREAHLAVVDEINGRVVLPRQAYADLYVADSPINFRGEAERYRDHALVTDLEAAIRDQGSFDFANYPLCADVSATHPTDMVHALANSSLWGCLSAQALYHRVVQPALTRRQLSQAEWAQLRQLMDGLTAQLTRHVDGSHFFFVGEAGSKATSRHMVTLAENAEAIKRELTALLS